MEIEELMTLIGSEEYWRFADHHEFCRFPNSTHSHYCYHATSYNCGECKRQGTRHHCPLIPITQRDMEDTNG